MSVTDEVREEIVAAFLGSCSHDFIYFEDMYDLDHNDILKILEEGEVFLCESCGWWFEFSEMNEDNGERLCTDCHEDIR